MKIALVGFAGWLACFAISFGLLNAEQDVFCHKEVPEICDAAQVRAGKSMAAAVSIMGPIGLAAAIIITWGGEDGFYYTTAPPLRGP